MNFAAEFCCKKIKLLNKFEKEILNLKAFFYFRNVDCHTHTHVRYDVT